MQCLMLVWNDILGDFTLSLDTLTDIRPLASPPEVSQSFKEVLSTLRSVGDAHWSRGVAWVSA